MRELVPESLYLLGSVEALGFSPASLRFADPRASALGYTNRESALNAEGPQEPSRAAAALPLAPGASPGWERLRRSEPRSGGTDSKWIQLSYKPATKKCLATLSTRLRHSNGARRWSGMHFSTKTAEPQIPPLGLKSSVGMTIVGSWFC